MRLLESEMNAVKAPLVLGVTGHRELKDQDVGVLKSRVTHIMHELRAKFPSTPFILLSPLAEGADRLVAEVALRPEMKTQLVVPLPMSIDLYENDFPNSKTEFYQLLHRAYASFEVLPPYDRHAVATDAKARDQRYEVVGKYIARECQILLALWDGAPSSKMGSTASVVQFQIQGLPEQLAESLRTPELFPVYHIVTPRLDGEAIGMPFAIEEIYPSAFVQEETPVEDRPHETSEQDRARGYYAKLFGNIESFNHQIEAGGSSLAGAAAKSKEQLVGGLWGIHLTAEEEMCLNRYAVADALAIRFRERVKRTHLALQWSVLLAFFFFVLFAHWEKHPPVLLALSFALLAFGYFKQKRARQKELDNKSQDYRAIAEGCRVAFFWHIGGIQDSVPDNYLAKQRTELDWIRTALRGWDIDFVGKTPTPPKLEKTRLRFVLRHWVEGQLDYFTGTARNEHIKLSKMEWEVSICLQLALGLAVTIFFADMFFQFPHFEWWSCEACAHWLPIPIIVIDVLLAAGALMHHSIQREALTQHNKQYQRTKGIFQNASRLLRDNLPNNVPVTKKWLLELGQRALEENGDWVMLHRDRPLELPHP
jgi:hypothetical protein